MELMSEYKYGGCEYGCAIRLPHRNSNADKRIDLAFIINNIVFLSLSLSKVIL